MEQGRAGRWAACWGPVRPRACPGAVWGLVTSSPARPLGSLRAGRSSLNPPLAERLGREV